VGTFLPCVTFAQCGSCACIIGIRKRTWWGLQGCENSFRICSAV